jgi:hypothetical protein
MCSIRNAAASAALALVAAAGTGCQWVGSPPSMRINDTPIAVDPAMERRDWPMQTAYYQNGVTVAGPTGQYVRPDRSLPQYAVAAMETPLAVGQIALLPFDFLWDPPWKDVAYPRAQAPASYTAAPPTNVTY